jgi:putative salt-induced outer membrane protein YdiY
MEEAFDQFARVVAAFIEVAAVIIVAINTIFSVKLAHTLRYSAAPSEGFDTTDTIMAVLLIAKVRRPR